MKSLILVSKKPVVIQIFTLVCKQLHISLEVLHEAQLDHKADIIVIDKDFISDRFNILKSYCKIIGAISKDELSFDIANDFTIPMPFIPSQLHEILDKQLELLSKRAKSKVYVSNVEVPDEEAGALGEYSMNDTYEDEFIIDDLAPKTPKRETTPIENDDFIQDMPAPSMMPSIDETENAVDYLEELADDIAFNMEEENDDSIVSVSSINQGGVLDNKELSMLEGIVNDTASEQMELDKFAKFDAEKNSEEWQDLSSIIDQAIDEVNMVDGVAEAIASTQSDDGSLYVLINNYELEQLKPILRLLDQRSIDMISDGHEINLKLKLDNGR